LQGLDHACLNPSQPLQALAIILVWTPAAVLRLVNRGAVVREFGEEGNPGNWHGRSLPQIVVNHD